jgi:hypothetical protein
MEASRPAFPSPKSLLSVFDKKYSEFANELKSVLPELSSQIKSSLAFSSEVRVKRFIDEVLPNCGPTRDASQCPGNVLPGVKIPESLWRDVGVASQSAIQEHLTLLSFCCMYEGAKTTGVDVSGAGAGAGADSSATDWTESVFNTMREKMGSMDFEGMSKKLTEILQNIGPESLPKLPERFLKGHLGKLVEELIKEFKPEDFGLSADELKECDSDPMGAFKLLTDIYTNKPHVLQNAIKRIASRLQEKIRRGELRPEQIASEAEEMIKDFSENGEFVKMMETFRNTFGMMDMDIARKSGQEQTARSNIVRERLRKKMEAKRNGASSNKK